jgi:protein TonB
MFETLLSPTGSSRGTRRRIAALPAAITLHAVALGAVAVAQLWAVEALPPPVEAMSPVLVVALAPPPPPPPPQRAGAGDRPAQPATGPVQPVAVPDGAPADPSSDDRADDLDGVEGGVAGGVDGGVPGGVPGSTAETNAGPRDDAATVYRVGGPVTAPVLVHRVVPGYPEAARRARLHGVVVVEAVIDRDGAVAEARVLGDTARLGVLAEAALRAVREWRYRPALLDGRPVAVRMTVTVTFSLD